MTDAPRKVWKDNDTLPDVGDKFRAVKPKSFTGVVGEIIHLDGGLDAVIVKRELVAAGMIEVDFDVIDREEAA